MQHQATQAKANKTQQIEAKLRKTKQNQEN